MDVFNELLLETIDETTRYCLGEKSAEIIFMYVEKKGVCKKDIPNKLDVFERELENIIGSERKEASDVGLILKKAYIAVFCMKLKIDCSEGDSQSFSEQVQRIRDSYLNSSR
jgi:hypothetical protein